MTEFLHSLTPIDATDPQAQICAFYLITVKGVTDPTTLSLGYREVSDEDGSSRMYYYRLLEGILEIEVRTDGQGGYTRQVTDFIADPRDVQDMLGASSSTSRTPVSASQGGRSPRSR